MPRNTNSSVLPEFSSYPSYLLGIEAFADGGTVKWKGWENCRVGYANSAGNADSISGYHLQDLLVKKDLRTDQNSIYELRLNFGGVDKGDYNGTYANEFPFPYQNYISLTPRDKNTAAIVFFECPTSNTLGRIAVRTRGAGDWNTQFSDFGYLAYTSDIPSTISWSNVTSKSLGVFEYQNIWLNPSRLQLMRYNDTSFSDRACVGVTDGNLHIDCYANKGLYLNYYSGNTTYIQGSSNYVTSSGYYTGSDRHLKKDITSIDKKELEDLFKVSECLFKEFKWKNGDTKSYGLIAQQIEKFIPEAISKNDKGVLSVNYEVAYAKILAMIIYKLKTII